MRDRKVEFCVALTKTVEDLDVAVTDPKEGNVVVTITGPEENLEEAEKRLKAVNPDDIFPKMDRISNPPRYQTPKIQIL